MMMQLRHIKWLKLECYNINININMNSDRYVESMQDVHWRALDDVF